MHKFFLGKNIYKVIAVSLVVLALLILLFNWLLSKKAKNTGTIPTSEVQNSLPKPQSIANIPTVIPEKGEGIDIESRLIQESVQEINKLNSNLPFSQDLKLSTGLTVSILIPDESLQENPWSLIVQIFGIEYEISQDSPNYQLMQNSFREAAGTVFAWMKAQGADPEKIIISWGDKEFIQQRADEWTSNN